jgi:O-antigen/teichoic acid export membrane protein
MPPWWTSLRNRFTPELIATLMRFSSALFGFGKAVVTIRILSPELLGVVAVMGAINKMLTDFIDIRLSDVATRLYYQHPQDAPPSQISQHRVQVMLDTILLSAGISILLAIVSSIVAFMSVSWFTQTPVQGWWLITHASMQALSNLAMVCFYLINFNGQYVRFGTLRAGIELCDFVAYVVLALAIGGIDGFYIANVIGSTIMLIGVLMLTLYGWKRVHQVAFNQLRIGTTFKDFRANWRVLFYGNFLGYGRMFHMSVDVLLVALLTDNTTTGLYRFARNIFEFTSLILYESLNQIFTPKLMQLLVDKNYTRFLQLRQQFLWGGLLGLGIFVVGEILFLPFAIGLVFGESYIVSANTIMILTIAPFLQIAFHIGNWTPLLHTGTLRGYTLFAMLGTVVQYALLLLFGRQISVHLELAGIAYLAHYLILIPAIGWLGRKKLHLLTHQMVYYKNMPKN